MLARTTRTNTRRLVAVVTAGGVCGLAGSYALASAEQTPAPTGHDQRTVAEWANSRGLTGLSPASLTTAPARPPTQAEMAERQRQVAEWANSRGLTGLSPASLITVSTTD